MPPTSPTHPAAADDRRVPRRVEVARPDPQPIAPGGSLLGPVATGSNRESLADHRSTKIATGNQTGSQQPIVLVDIFGATIDRTGSEQMRHAVARSPAAGPGPTIRVGTILGQFGGIEADKPDAVHAQAEAIAIAGATMPGNGRRRLIEGGRNHCRDGQKPDGEERSTGATKEAVALAESTQDFTTR